MSPAVSFSLPLRSPRPAIPSSYNIQDDIDWNPEEEMVNSGTAHYPTPVFDAADLYDPYARRPSNNMPPASSPPPLLEPSRPSGRAANAASYDPGRSLQVHSYPNYHRHDRRRPQRHRAYTSDSLLSHPVFQAAPSPYMPPSAPAHFYPSPMVFAPHHHPPPHPYVYPLHVSPGWGNEDAYPIRDEHFSRPIREERFCHFLEEEDDDLEEQEFRNFRRNMHGTTTSTTRRNDRAPRRGQNHQYEADRGWPDNNNNNTYASQPPNWGSQSQSGGGDNSGIADNSWANDAVADNSWAANDGGATTNNAWPSDGVADNGWAAHDTARNNTGTNPDAAPQDWYTSGDNPQDTWGNGGDSGAAGWTSGAANDTWGSGAANDTWGSGAADANAVDQGQNAWGTGDGTSQHHIYTVVSQHRGKRQGSATDSSWSNLRTPSTSTGPILVSGAPPGALERTLLEGVLSTGPFTKMKNLFRPTISLHPFLSSSTNYTWDVRRVIDPARCKISLGTAVSGLTEPATYPPCRRLDLHVTIKELGDCVWHVRAYCLDEQPDPSTRTPPLNYSFMGHPTPFGLKFPRNMDTNTCVRVHDVLHTLHLMLDSKARPNDWDALVDTPRTNVGSAFWLRTAEFQSVVDGRHYVHTSRGVPGQEAIDAAVAQRVKEGLKRVDFLVDKTRFKGLKRVKGLENAWEVVLENSNDAQLPVKPPEPRR